MEAGIKLLKNALFIFSLISFIFLLLLCINGLIASATGAEPEDEQVTLNISSRAAIVIDFDTGMELYNHNADERRNPASMTKMMAAYIVYEAIERGDIAMDTLIPVSASAAQLSRNPNETNVPLSSSSSYTVSDLLDAVIVVSAAGATRALAEYLAGSRDTFVVLMNKKIAEWGLDAHFISDSGGPQGAYVTPRAMAEITRIFINDFPEILEKTALPRITFAGRTYESTNKLINEYEGIDGFKTGTNNHAGACFTATVIREDTRIISVTMGSSYNSRFPDSAKLLDRGFEVMEQIVYERNKITARINLLADSNLRTLIFISK